MRMMCELCRTTCTHGGQLMLMMRGFADQLHRGRLMLMTRDSCETRFTVHVSAGPGVHNARLLRH